MPIRAQSRIGSGCRNDFTMSGSPANFCPVWFQPLITLVVDAAKTVAAKCPEADFEVLRQTVS